jgi:hypothetical protein
MPNFRTTTRSVNDDETGYTAEAELVQRRAQRHEPSVIRRGQIIFFSTESGDAWVLDAKGGEAACLAREGALDPIPIEESATRFGVAWQGRYRFEGNLFIVAAESGGESVMPGYPAKEIQRLIEGHAPETLPVPPDAEAIRQRVRCTGRNHACPCGRGKKYKKCCLPADEAALFAVEARERGNAAPEPPAETQDEDEAEPGDGATIAEEKPERGEEAGAREDAHGYSELPSEVRREVNRLWEEYRRLERPSTEQMNALLDQLLVLPPEATSWSELFEDFARYEHADLPAVFRRIAAGVRPTRGAALGFFYLTAFETFVPRGQIDLVPEIVAGFCRLDGESYNIDALKNVEDWVRAVGCDAEALALAERFLPVVHSDDNLLPHVAPDTAQLIFHLRAGVQLREAPGSNPDPATLARELRRDIEDEIDGDYIQRTAEVISVPDRAQSFTHGDFVFPSDTQTGPAGREKGLRCFETLVHVAREAWEIERRAPGTVLHGMVLLVRAAYDDRADWPERQRGAPLNLLECLAPSGMERRVARAARSFVGTNRPRAHLLLEAHADLLRFAVRHRLIAAPEAAKSETNIAILKKKIGFADGGWRTKAP